MEARRLYRPACLGGAGQLAAAEQGWFSFRERNKEKNQVLPWISWDIRHMWIADTLHGKVYECPVVEGVRFLGDGYTHCEASGSGRCEINNGGCWKETRDGCTYSACAALVRIMNMR